MTNDILRILSVMQELYGQDLSRYDESFLAKSLASRYTATGSATVDDYCICLSEIPGEADALCCSLRITYSEFFRNSLSFALLEHMVLPTLIASSRRSGLRIWSAGCAAGQEAYSLAILLHEAAIAREHPVPYRIVATDISTKELARAESGVYSAADVANVRLKQIEQAFRLCGNDYQVNQTIRDHIDFSVHDLLDPHVHSPPTGIYGDYDLVICSNLLFYYRKEIRQGILEKLDHSLAAGGYLVTGEAEREMAGQIPGLHPVCRPAAVFRKQERQR